MVVLCNNNNNFLFVLVILNLSSIALTCADRRCSSISPPSPNAGASTILLLARCRGWPPAWIRLSIYCMGLGVGITLKRLENRGIAWNKRGIAWNNLETPGITRKISEYLPRLEAASPKHTDMPCHHDDAQASPHHANQRRKHESHTPLSYLTSPHRKRLAHPV
jgi:hypothetical protein